MYLSGWEDITGSLALNCRISPLSLGLRVPKLLFESLSPSFGILPVSLLKTGFL